MTQAPLWSLDGRKLYIIGTGDNLLDFIYQSMTMAEISSKKTIRLEYSVANAGHPSAYFPAGSHTPALTLSEYKKIWKASLTTNFANPLVSRDGQWELSFDREGGIFVVSTQGGKSRRASDARGLKDVSADNPFASWSPAAKRIVYGGAGIHLVDLKSQTTTDLVESESGVEYSNPIWIKNDLILILKGTQGGRPGVQTLSNSLMSIRLKKPIRIEPFLKSGQENVSVQKFSVSPVSGQMAILGQKSGP